MLQGYGNMVLHAEAFEKELDKAKKHSTLLQSKLDGAFAQYHNEVQEMQVKSDDLAGRTSLYTKRTKVRWASKVIEQLLTCLVVF
jgi:hypothetical protein